MSRSLSVHLLSYFRTSSALFLLFGVFHSTLAFSQTKAMGWKSREMTAKKSCNVGDYQTGIDILGDLYVETNDSTYLFNQARCYQQNDRYEQAISRFREYLRKSPEISEKEKELVDGHIAECQAELTKKQPSPTTTTPIVTEPIASSSEPLMMPKQSAPLPEPVAQPGQGMRVAGIVTGVVGLAALGTGVGLNWYHNKEVARYAAMTERPSNADTNLQQYKTLTLVGLGLGSAALVTGIVLYYFGWRSGTVGSTESDITVVAIPDGAFFTCRGAF